MKVYHFGEGPAIGQYAMLVSDLLDADPVHTGEWQAMKTGSSPMHATHELEDVSLVWDRMPSDFADIMPFVDQPWATEHFAERVSGIPHNPAPSAVRWPYAVRNNTDHTTDSGTYDHTYPERFWPQHAGHDHSDIGDWWTDGGKALEDNLCGGHEGIRFHYGDLADVVSLLARAPLTRQAYLPVWFPEDTGAISGQRVPCTLGYHFMQRGGRLTCRYYIRSCDAYRHLSNDVWFAAALTRWITDEVYKATADNEVSVRFRPGGLLMHIASLHSFVGDDAKLIMRLNRLAMS
jgi:hypothetical protein